MHRALCSDLIFSIQDSKSPSHVTSKYKLGRFEQEILYLTPFEALFLFFKGKIKPENTYFSDSKHLMQKLLPETGDLVLYSVYESIKLKGFYVKREGDSLFFRKSPKMEYSGPLNVMRESRNISYQDLAELEESLVATVDDENDITYFKVYSIDPAGSAEGSVEPGSDSETVSDRFVLSRGSVPEWMGHVFKGVTFLTELEESYIKLLEEEGKEQYAEGSPLFLIYLDLMRKHLIVKTGFKYGTNFRAYTRTMEEHADYLVHYFSGNEEWYKISRAVRVAHGVHKVIIFAGIIDGVVRYTAVERIKDPSIS